MKKIIILIGIIGLVSGCAAMDGAQREPAQIDSLDNMVQQQQGFTCYLSGSFVHCN